MAKVKTVWVCNACGGQSPKWVGRCPHCGAWNSFEETVIDRGNGKSPASAKLSTTGAVPKALTQITPTEEFRIVTGDNELNRVLGGGIVPGSVVLVAGEPGIGKSTLMMQLALQMVEGIVLYVSGEESENQLSMRAARLGKPRASLHVLATTSLADVKSAMEQIQPALLIVDSIQTMQSENIDSIAGSISQIRECTGELQQLAKSTGIPVFLIGHITKDGAIAGPKILEHIVDTVLYFEGDMHYNYRILRTRKNRFGATSELGIYEMTGNGLRGVENPSELLMGSHEASLSGSAIAAMVEGGRPMLIEVQALVAPAVYSAPQRTSTGYYPRRLNMMLAVLEKRLGIRLATHDVFVNIAGGLQVDDPAVDLAVVAAILSSYEDIPLNKKYCFAGEVGLSGEIRAVNRIDQRIMEATRIGFEKIFISRYNAASGEGGETTKHKNSTRVEKIALIQDLYNKLFA